MKKHGSYEDWGVSSITAPIQENVAEALRGVQVVGWHGRIENRLVTMVQKAKADKNPSEAQEIEQFLETWRKHRLTGSVNREDVEALEAAAAQLGVRDWKLAGYFRSLRTSLLQIIAGEEELPRPDNDSAPKHRPSISPPSTSFGPENDPMPDDGKDDGAEKPEEGKPGDEPAGEPGGDLGSNDPGLEKPGKNALPS